MIPYGKHFIDNNDIDAVVKVLKSGFLTQGPEVQKFESKIAKYVGAKYAVAVSSGTAALHIAALALDLKEGSKVITSPNTFVATSNSILYVNAKPVFVDIDQKTLNIDINEIEKQINNSKDFKAIFPVHFAGLPVEMRKIKQLADKYDLAIVEDASHALGAKYINGEMVGSCKYSNMTTLSFHPVKGIAAGEGGMITTNDSKLYHKLIILRSHGISKGNFEFPGISQPDNILNIDEALEDNELKRWYYEMQYLGLNYRITDIQCALACSQMEKIDMFLERRKELVAIYDQTFSQHPHISPFQTHAREQSSHHIYTINIDFDKVNLTRQQFMKKLAKKGVGSQVHYIPVTSHPYYQKLGYSSDDLPVTQQYYQNTLSIPLYYGLSDKEQELVINSINSIIG